MPFALSRAAAFGAASSLLALYIATTPAVAQDEQSTPASSVGVIVVQSEAIAISSELPGRISATRISDVRPRVAGIIETREFKQGTVVEEGDVLFRLDRATYEISVEAAEAVFARAEAVLVDARQNEERLTELRERNVASDAAYKTALAERLQAEASVAEAGAQLRAAKINLDYTEVKAPISGRIGRAQASEGALVAAQGEILATIQQLDPVYADMQQPVSELLRLREALRSGALEQVEPDVARVVLYLDDGSQYGPAGRLLFAEAAVERSSGQVTLRAEFPNPDDILLPGMYVRVSVEQATEANAIAIPSQAVQRNASGASEVYLVKADGTVELRIVELGRASGNRTTVNSGLSVGDTVVVDGFQKIGPGASVAPVCWVDPSLDDAKTPEICVERVAALKN